MHIEYTFRVEKHEKNMRSEMTPMVYCSKCGKENEDDVTFCAGCGAELYPERGRRRRRIEKSFWREKNGLEGN